MINAVGEENIKIYSVDEQGKAKKIEATKLRHYKGKGNDFTPPDDSGGSGSSPTSSSPGGSSSDTSTSSSGNSSQAKNTSQPKNKANQEFELQKSQVKIDLEKLHNKLTPEQICRYDSFSFLIINSLLEV